MIVHKKEEKLAGSSPTPDDVTLNDEPVNDASATAISDSNAAQDDTTQFLSGLKLLLVMTSVTVIMILAMLDIAILGTVSSRFTHLPGPSFADYI